MPYIRTEALIQLNKDTELNLRSQNVVYPGGMPIFCTDTGDVYITDGASTFYNLDPIYTPEDGKGFYGYVGSNLTLPRNTNTIIGFAIEYNDNNCYNSTTKTFTVPKTGVYSICFNLIFDGLGSTTTTRVILDINGITTEYQPGNRPLNGRQILSGIFTRRLDKDSFIRILGFSSSNGSRITSNYTDSYVTIHKLR